MTVTFVINMTSCLLASVLAGATLARDPGVKANRLMAAILACAAWWSFCEVVWNQCVDPMQALWWIRISGLGWLWLGALSLHIAIEVHGDPNTRIRHAIPVAYAAATGSVALYLGTPWCITVDGETAENGTVTLRDRDSMVQERVPGKQVGIWLVFLAFVFGAPALGVPPRVVGIVAIAYVGLCIYTWVAPLLIGPWLRLFPPR